MILCFEYWVCECCENEWDVWWNNVSYAQVNGILLYDIYTYMLFYFSLLVRNVITHSLCVVCVWILWWSWTLCSGEQMTRWSALRNLMLKDVGTQCSDRMWQCGISFYIIAFTWSCYFSKLVLSIYFKSLIFFLFCSDALRTMLVLSVGRGIIAPLTLSFLL